MREMPLQAEVRTQLGKHTHALRREGKVPGVYYVHGEDNILIAVSEKSLHPLIYTSDTHIINLKLNNGGDKNCILRDIQFDPVSDRPIHFDLQGLREDEEITIEIPVVITGGIPQGVRDGGILQQIIHKMKISCLPKNIPEHVEVNAEQLKMSHFIHVRDLMIPNVTILEHAENSIVGVVPPVVEKEPEPGTVATEEIAEPEVIAKGKKTEEEVAEGEAATPEKKTEATAKQPTAPAKEEKKKADASTRREEKKK